LIRCRFGFHRWKFYYGVAHPPGGYHVVRCERERCGLIRHVYPKGTS
jgi:hypothetical protein